MRPAHGGVRGWILELLARCLPPGPSREGLIGDLSESYARLARERGEGWASIRLAVEAAGLALRFGWRRLRERDSRRERAMSGWIQDLRFSLRTMTRRPTLSVAIVASLALGIGGNTAIFSVLDGTILRPLPYDRPDELVQLWGSDTERGLARFGVSLHDYEDWRAGSRTIEEMGAYVTRIGNLTGSDVPVRATYGLVTPSLFELLGVAPTLGRIFSSEENDPGRDGVVLISHGLWASRFGGDPAVVGKTLVLDGAVLEIIGVMPETFYFTNPTVELWKPFGMRPDDSGDRGGRWVRALGRLGDGETVQTAQTEMSTIGAALAEAYPESNADFDVFVEPQHEAWVLGWSTMVWMLWGGVTLVLVVACANVANLLLARTKGREEEFAVRTSLGAGRGRLVRQLLVEGLVLSGFGGLLGLVLGFWGTRGLSGLQGSLLPSTGAIQMSGRIFVYAMAVTVLCGLAMSIVPALRSSRSPALGLGRGAVTRSAHRLQRGLVIGELALTLVVLTGGALIASSFWSLTRVDLGFDPEGIAATRISPSWTDIPERPSAVLLYEDVLGRVESIPGVTRAVAVNTLPLAGANVWRTRFWTPTVDAMDPGVDPAIQYRVATPGYLEMLGIPLIRGRYFDENDRAGEPGVVVVSRSLAERYWPDRDPIGELVDLAPVTDPRHVGYRVIGVVEDVHDNTAGAAPNPAAYFPFAQAQWGHFQDWGMSVLAETDGEPSEILRDLESAARAGAPGLPAFDSHVLGDRVRDDVAIQRFNATLVGLFAVAALILSAVGIYGVLSYMIERRTREIGMRLALGADRRSVVGLVMRQASVLGAAGLGVGILGMWLLRETLERVLFGVSVVDGWAMTGSALFLFSVAILAAWVPAARAARLQPVECLMREG